MAVSRILHGLLEQGPQLFDGCCLPLLNGPFPRETYNIAACLKTASKLRKAREKAGGMIQKQTNKKPERAKQKSQDFCLFVFVL
jgi:hypothetical protein